MLPSSHGRHIMLRTEVISGLMAVEEMFEDLRFPQIRFRPHLNLDLEIGLCYSCRLFGDAELRQWAVSHAPAIP